MLHFAAAVFFLIVTPGPGVLSTAGVGAAFGFRAGLAYVLGLFVGNNLVAALTLTGVAAIALALPWLRTLLLIASLAYLCWLAWRIASAGAKVGFIAADRPLGFWIGSTKPSSRSANRTVRSRRGRVWPTTPERPWWQVFVPTTATTLACGPSTRAVFRARSC